MKQVCYQLVGLISLTSCEKNYSCTCREIDTTTGKVINTWPTQRGLFTKKEASDWCYKNNTNLGVRKLTCELKEQ